MTDAPAPAPLRKENECMDLFSSSLGEGPIVVTFVWPPVPFPHEAMQSAANTVSIAVSSWDPEAIIDTVRKRGGVWVDGPEPASRYFLPWPPSAVHVVSRAAPPAPILK